MYDVYMLYVPTCVFYKFARSRYQGMRDAREDENEYRFDILSFFHTVSLSSFFFLYWFVMLLLLILL